MTYNIELVNWEDTFVQGGWQSMDAYKKIEPSKCVSVGVVIRDDETTITLMQTLTTMDSASDSITIPVGCIVSRRVIETVEWYDDMGSSDCAVHCHCMRNE